MLKDCPHSTEDQSTFLASCWALAASSLTASAIAVRYFDTVGRTKATAPTATATSINTVGTTVAGSTPKCSGSAVTMNDTTASRPADAFVPAGDGVRTPVSIARILANVRRVTARSDGGLSVVAAVSPPCTTLYRASGEYVSIQKSAGDCGGTRGLLVTHRCSTELDNLQRRAKTPSA